MAHRSHRQTNRDLRYVIQRSFADCPGFGDHIQVDGKINRIAEGLWHDNYWFFIEGPGLQTARIEQAYVLRLVQQQHDWQRVPESHDRLVREANTLQALMTSDFAHLTPEFICFVMDEDTQPIGMIETAVSGVSLDRCKDRSTLKRISKVAADVHRMETRRFAHLQRSNTRAQHIQLRLEELDEDLFATYSLAEQVRDWIVSHLPSDDHTCVLHGDLLPQNVLHDWQGGDDSEGLIAVVDWEMAQIGDPAYDLAIVSRGNRKVHGVPDGLKFLLHHYIEFGGRKISLTDVHAHELILLMQWLEESWREHQKPKPRGHAPGFYESQLQSLFRRTVNRSAH